MALNILGISKKISLKGKDNWFYRMGLILETLKIAKWMEKVYSNIKMGRYMMVNTKTTKSMDSGNMHFSKKLMREIGKME